MFNNPELNRKLKEAEERFYGASNLSPAQKGMKLKRKIKKKSSRAFYVKNRVTQKMPANTSTTQKSDDFTTKECHEYETQIELPNT